MVHDMKLCTPNSRTMISHLPDLYEALVARRNDARREKLQVLAHHLQDAADEILAPCMLTGDTHLYGNWPQFVARWSPRYADLWKQCEMAGGGGVAYKFMLGGASRARWVHCVCKAHEHALLQFEDKWRDV